jgi:hypothetical protein
MLRAPSFPFISAERVGIEKVDEHYTIYENALEGEPEITRLRLILLLLIT